MPRVAPFVRLRTVFLVASLIAGSPPGVAAETRNSSDAARPRIGLVLAGGGARGIGHVGVIRLLEELNIQVDYVAGTSMGSIIGGLYAAGFNSREMVEWLEQCDWDHLLSDTLPRPERGFRIKSEELDTPRWIEMGIGWSGVKVPNAFISGQNLLVALREKTSFVGARRSFDELPVPFRAVATDVETGEMVVIDRGTVADAMRASMAVPGAFAPFRLHGRVLIDGFASRNLPVSVARDMGAEVIIAVDVRGDLQSADKLTNPISMAEQLLSILSQRDTLEQIATLGQRDVLVRLRLPGFGNSSFRECLQIAQQGYEEARAARDALAALALAPADYEEREKARRQLRRDLPVIAAIEVEGGGRIAAAAVRRRLSVKVGERLDPDALRESLGRIHNLGYFERVDYRIDDRPEGRVLVVSTQPKPWGPNFFIFGIGLGSDLDGASELNVRTSFRFTQLNRFGAELGLKTSVGNVDRLDAEFYQPLGEHGHLFLAPRGELLRLPERYTVALDSIVPGARPLSLEFQRQTAFAGLAAGLRLGSNGELRVGAERGSVRYSKIRAQSILLVTPTEGITAVDTGQVLKNYSATRASSSLILDRLDQPFFPTRGYYFHGYVEREFGGYGSTIAGLTTTAPVRLGRLVVQPRLAANYTLKSADANARLPFHVGGLFNLSGVPTDEAFGSNSFVGSLVLRRGLGGTSARPSLYVGGSLEAGNAWDGIGRTLPEQWVMAGSAFVAVDTLVGPVHLAVGRAEGRSATVYFYLGRVLP